MLILIFSDIEYLQEVVSSFEEGSNGQSHCSLHPIKNHPPGKFLIPPNLLTIFRNPALERGHTMFMQNFNKL